MSSDAQSRVHVTIAAIDRLTEPLRRMSRNVQRLTQPLQRVRDMAGRIGRATGLDRIGRAAQAATRRVRALNDSLNAAQSRNRQALAESRGQIMEGVGWAAAAYGALRPAVAFEDSIARVGAVANASGEDMERLSQSAREIGRVAPVGASDAADAMGYLGMAGFDTNQILAATPDLVNLSIAGGTEIARTADIASNVLSGFGLAAEDMDRVADTLAATVSSANVDVAMLGDTMAYVAPAAASAGASLEEAAAMAGLLGDVGIQGSRAGTALNAVYSRLSSPVGEAAQALSDLGIEAADADGNLRAVPEILGDLAHQVEGMGSAELSDTITRIFGREPASAVQELLNQSIDGSLSAYINELSDAEGAAQSLADRMQDTTGGALRRLSSAAEGVAITIGDIFLPALADIAEYAAAAANRISEFAERYPNLTRWVGYAAGGLVALRLALIAVNIASLVVQGGLIGAALGVTRLASAVLLLFSPIGLVIGAIAALAAGAYLVYRHWDSVSEWLGTVWGWIADTATAAFSAIIDFLGNWHPSALVARAVNSIVDTLFGIDMFALGREWIGALADGVAGAWEGFADWLTGAITSLLDWMPDMVKEKLGIEVTATPLSDDEIDAQAAETARRQTSGRGPGRGAGYDEAFQRERERLRAENARIRNEAADQIAIPEMPTIAATAERSGPDIGRYRLDTPAIQAPAVAAYTPGATRPTPAAPSAPTIAPIDTPAITSAIDSDATAPAMAEIDAMSASLTDMDAGLVDIDGRLADLDQNPTDLSGETITGVADAIQQPPPDINVTVSEGAVVINVANGGDPEAIRQAVDQGLRRTVTNAGRDARASLYD